MIDKDFYTVQEAAQLLGLSCPTIREYCKTGVIPSVHAGNRYRIPAGALHTWAGSKVPTDPGQGQELATIATDLREAARLLESIQNRLNEYILQEKNKDK